MKRWMRFIKKLFVICRSLVGLHYEMLNVFVVSEIALFTYNRNIKGFYRQPIITLSLLFLSNPICHESHAKRPPFRAQYATYQTIICGIFTAFRQIKALFAEKERPIMMFFAVLSSFSYGLWEGLLRAIAPRSTTTKVSAIRQIIVVNICAIQIFVVALLRLNKTTSYGTNEFNWRGGWANECHP